ncbi:SPFH domain-containing protein [Tautonia sociabilis]|uniref:Band 7 protein n=1 Tax=Tautonia sociabilis TaxID=2080755 RepID=A0A432MDH8_9BACT|nr:SPFH domain-containing protein [Tautonia sociabilis]RUL82778.1 band 7 protein [Tautonia sociabilis]
MNPRTVRLAIGAAALLSAVSLGGYLFAWKWVVCRVEVAPGESLLLTYRGPFPPIRSVPTAPKGTLVQRDDRGRPQQVGILEEMLGPGRHFINPLEYKYERIADTIIKPGEIGVLTAKFGEQLPQGQYLADREGQRGIQRKVLTTGRYRINSYAYDVEVRPVSACVKTNGGVRHQPGDALLIPAGYVGVVTNRSDDPRTGAKRGTQDDVLQPGIYYLNPYATQVDILSIGYNETTLSVEAELGPDGQPKYQEVKAVGVGEPAPLSRDPVYRKDRGIWFLSRDGFDIFLDFTTIWGILPDQAADVIRRFGKASEQEQNVLKVVEEQVVLPDIGSIARINGSRHGAVDLLIGDSREAFQTDTSEDLEARLKEKNLTLLFGLTRHIYVPAEVREPIQRSKIAMEVKLTNDQKQLTAEAEGDLMEAKAKVVLEERRVAAETEKLFAEALAEGEKQAKQIEAETERLVAELDAQTAAIQAQITTTIGEAEAKKVELTNAAQADRYRRYVETLGGPDAYNRYLFAENLPDDLRLGVFYAGPGTFWTDLRGVEQVLLGKLASDSISPGSPPPATSTPPPTVPQPASVRTPGRR